MCLSNLFDPGEYPAPPDGSIRWKLMLCGDDGTSVRGTNYDYSAQKCGEVRRSNVDGVLDEDERPYRGIHVCADEASFEEVYAAYSFEEVYAAYRCNGWGRLAKVKVECRGFLEAGRANFVSHAKGINETWREVTILEITPLPLDP